MNRNYFNLIMAIAIMIMLSSNALAIGIAPARTTFDFSSGMERTVDVTILNSDKKDMSVSMHVSGDLEDFITLSGNSFRISADETSRVINYKVKLPSQLAPGTYKTDIVALELADESGEDGTVIGVSLAVMTRLIVNVPYPGKYIISELNINGAAPGEEVTFIMPIKNAGKADILSLKANINIYNKLNEEIYSFNTETINLVSGGEAELVGKWKNDEMAGTYFAKVTIIYDAEILALEKLFNIGNAELELEEISVRDFSLGQIAKLEMLVENKWGEEVLDAYTQTKIYDNSGNTISEFKSLAYNIPALSKSVMVSYWDSGGFKEGTYEASVYLNYGQKSTQKDLRMKVSQNSLEIIGLGYVISEKSSNKGGSVNTILAVAVVVLVLLNLIWFMMLRKKLFGNSSK